MYRSFYSLPRGKVIVGFIKTNTHRQYIIIMDTYKCKINVIQKPAVRPKPFYLRHICSGSFVRNKEGAWSKRVRFALATDLLHGRHGIPIPANTLTTLNRHFHLVHVILFRIVTYKIFEDKSSISL